MDRRQLEVLLAGLRTLRKDLETQEAQIANGLTVLQGLEQEAKQCGNHAVPSAIKLGQLGGLAECSYAA